MTVESIVKYAIILIVVLTLHRLVSKPLDRWWHWRSLARSYRKFPPHQNVEELAARIERLGDCFLDRASARLAEYGGRSIWEWQLGMDLKELVDIVRSNIPADNYTSNARLGARYVQHTDEPQ
jgi:hypothetical protein